MRRLNVSPEARTQRPVDKRLITGLSAGREALFVPGCGPVDRRLSCVCKPFSCKACPGILDVLGQLGSLDLALSLFVRA